MTEIIVVLVVAAFVGAIVLLGYLACKAADFVDTHRAKKFAKRYPTIDKAMKRHNKLMSDACHYWNTNCADLWRTIERQRESIATATTSERAILDKTIDENVAQLHERSKVYRNTHAEADKVKSYIQDFAAKAKIGDNKTYRYLKNLGWTE